MCFYRPRMRCFYLSMLNQPEVRHRHLNFEKAFLVIPMCTLWLLINTLTDKNKCFTGQNFFKIRKYFLMFLSFLQFWKTMFSVIQNRSLDFTDLVMWCFLLMSDPCWDSRVKFCRPKLPNTHVLIPAIHCGPFVPSLFTMSLFVATHCILCISTTTELSKQQVQKYL